MKTLIERILTNESAREGGLDAQVAAAVSEKFYPWGSRATM